MALRDFFHDVPNDDLTRQWNAARAHLDDIFDKALAVKLYDFNLPGLLLDAPHAAFFESWLAAGRAGEMKYLERNVAKRRSPALLAEPGQAPFASMIVLRVDYHQYDLPAEIRDDPSRGIIASYAWGDDYHELIRPLLYELDAYIRSVSGRSTLGKCLVDTGPVLEREQARRVAERRVVEPRQVPHHVGGEPERERDRRVRDCTNRRGRRDGGRERRRNREDDEQGRPLREHDVLEQVHREQVVHPERVDRRHRDGEEEHDREREARLAPRRCGISPKGDHVRDGEHEDRERLRVQRPRVRIHGATLDARGRDVVAACDPSKVVAPVRARSPASIRLPASLVSTCENERAARSTAVARRGQVDEGDCSPCRRLVVLRELLGS